jgi:hypothetical protein
MAKKVKSTITTKQAVQNVKSMHKGWESYQKHLRAKGRTVDRLLNRDKNRVTKARETQAYAKAKVKHR